MARLSTIATAVTTSLNAASLSETFTAIRYWRIPQALADITGEATPRVFVLGVGWVTVQSRTSRDARMLLDYLVDVAVVKAIDTTDVDAADPYTDFTEEIRNHLMSAGDMGTANFINAETSPLIDIDRYDQEQLFVSGTRFTYRAFDE